MSNEYLDSAVDSMPRDIKPDNDLWPGIEARISTERHGVRAELEFWSLYRVAAVLALVALTALVVLQFPRDANQGTTEVADAKEMLYPLVVPASLEDSQAFDEKYQQQRQEMLDLLDETLADMTPDTRAKVEENLKQINRALADISDALSGDPNNVLLQQLLLSMYQEELAVFENVNRITKNLPPRTET